MRWEFTTEAFRDAPGVREENVNGIEGRGLAEALRTGLRARGLTPSEVWPEDHGWDFMVEAPDGAWLCVVSLDPLNDGEDRTTARTMCAIVQATKQRGLWDRLRGRNRESGDEAVPVALASILEGHSDLRPSA